MWWVLKRIWSLKSLAHVGNIWADVAVIKVLASRALQKAHFLTAAAMRLFSAALDPDVILLCQVARPQQVTPRSHRWQLHAVLGALFLASDRTFSLPELAVQELFWKAVVWHLYLTTCPAHLTSVSHSSPWAPFNSVVEHQPVNERSRA